MIKQLEYAESILRSNPLNAYDISTSEDIEYTTGSADHLDALYIESKALWLMSRFEEAIDRADTLNDLAIDKNDLKGQVRANNTIGNVYYDMSNYDRALDHYMQGLSLSKTINDAVSEASFLNNIGEIYKSLEAYDEAFSYYTKSMAIGKNLESSPVYGISHLNIGELLFKQGKIDEAYDYAKYSLDLFRENEDYISISHDHLLLARIHRTRGNDGKARADLMLAIDIMRRMQDHYNLNLAYLEMIDLLISDGEYEEALEYVEDGIDISERLNVKKDLADIALNAAIIYEKIDQPHESLGYYKKYVDAKLLYEKEKEEEHQKNITAQIRVNNAMHEKEIFRLRNVELKKKSDEIHKLYDDMKVINNIGQDITSTLDIKRILYLLYENVNKLMDATLFGIYLYDNNTEMIDTNLFLVYGRPTQSLDIHIDSKTSLGAWSIRNKKGIFTNNFDDGFDSGDIMFSPDEMDNHPTRSVIVVPLLMRDEAIGAITVQSSNRDAYKDYHFNQIRALASYIAIAIRNSQESQKLSEEIEERIKTQSKLEVLNERLSHLSYMDALTQIPNRRSFVEYITRELSRSKRLESALVLFIIDIDFFKEYNDNYGHVEGDKCLTKIAGLLKGALKRDIDFVARYGGDEFVAVMTDIDYDGGDQIAEQMKHVVKEAAIEHKFSRIEDIITITIGGLVLVPKQEETMEMVIHRADKALYDAKDKGRNQICFYNDLKN